MDDYIEFNDDLARYEEDDGFDNYVQTTIDPGDTLFIFTTAFCMLSIMALPFLVGFGNKRAAKRKAKRHSLECDSSSKITTKITITNVEQVESDSVEAEQEKHDGINATENDADEASNAEELSIFSKIEREYLIDDPFSQGDESDSYCFGLEASNGVMSDILQTPFCCVGPDMKTVVELPPISPERSKKRTHEGAFPASSGSSSKNPLNLIRNSSRDSLGKVKKNNRRRRLKKAFRSMAKSQPMIPSNNNNDKAPKTTLLDGGFFGQRKHRNHGVINEKQIKREEKRDKSILCCVCFDETFCVEVEIGDEMDDISVNSADGEHNLAGGTSICMPTEQACCGGLYSAARTTIKILRMDREFQRIAALMLPFTITSILSKIFEGIDIALISWRLGTESLAAYAVANYIVELSFQSLRGFTDAQATLCAHAIGAKNNHLAGQYVQLSVVAFLICGIMLAFLVDTFTYDILIWLDMNSDIANIGQQWASVAAWAGVINGVNEAFFQFMNVMDTDIWSNVIMMLMSAVNTFAIALTLLNEDTNLAHIGIIKLGTAILFIVINIAFMASKGWLDDCWSGLVESFALKNRVAMKQILKTGIPLSLGSLAREIEGGVLVIFASTMGAAEVAVWTIVRTLSDIFAACMEGICCAAEIRSAYFIGTGNISSARITSYKSLMIGILFGAILTYGFYELFEDHVKLFTQDATLQEMILDLVPLICISNMTMAAGMLCWSLIGAQGRFRLATLITFLSGWLVTIPLAAFFVFLLHINLQGLVAAVTIGYSVSSTALMYLLIRSNWNKRVEKVKRATVHDYEEQTQDSPVEDDASIENNNTESNSDGDRIPAATDQNFNLELANSGELTYV